MEILKDWAILMAKMGEGGVDHYREIRGVGEIRGGELTQKFLGISMSNVYIEL